MRYSRPINPHLQQSRVNFKCFRPNEICLHQLKLHLKLPLSVRIMLYDTIKYRSPIYKSTTNEVFQYILKLCARLNTSSFFFGPQAGDRTQDNNYWQASCEWRSCHGHEWSPQCHTRNSWKTSQQEGSFAALLKSIHVKILKVFFENCESHLNSRHKQLA